MCEADQIAAALEAALENLLQNKPIGELALPPAYRGVTDALLLLERQLAEVGEFTVHLAGGEIDSAPPGRSNCLAGGLKQLQAHLRHLSWQTQCVAQGDYDQSVDFMGEFSHAFNSMIKQLKEREGRIKSQQEFMQRLFDRLEPIFVVSEEDTSEIIYANSQARKAFSMNEESPSLFIRQALELAGEEGEREMLDIDTGRWYSVETGKLPWSEVDDAILFFCMDITCMKERQSSLEEAANTDTLTGLYNRRALESSFTTLWDACMQANKPLSVLMFDIDFFKKYNDTYGHLQGDRCLAAFAKILNVSAARSSDVIARYGGEEFVVLLPFTEREHALEVAERIRKAASELKVMLPAPGKGDVETTITVSGGVSSFTPGQEGYIPEDLLHRADEALYAAKAAGRNRVFYQALEGESYNPS